MIRAGYTKRPKRRLPMMAPTKNMAWAKFGRQSSSQTQLLCKSNKYKRTGKVYPSSRPIVLVMDS